MVNGKSVSRLHVNQTTDWQKKQQIMMGSFSQSTKKVLNPCPAETNGEIRRAQQGSENGGGGLEAGSARVVHGAVSIGGPESGECGAEEGIGDEVRTVE